METNNNEGRQRVCKPSGIIKDIRRKTTEE
jgi:hypothetical protein